MHTRCLPLHYVAVISRRPLGFIRDVIADAIISCSLMGYVARLTAEPRMDATSIFWFGIGGSAALFALSLLYQRYVKRTTQAMQSRGSFALFAILMAILAIGAILAGVASSSV